MNIMDEINEYNALLMQIAELQKKADAQRQRVELRAALAVREIMAEHRLSPDQVMMGWATKKGMPKQKSAQPVRYRDDAGNTWSGMGRAPRWIVAAPDRSVYRIA